MKNGMAVLFVMVNFRFAALKLDHPPLLIY